MVPAIEVAQVAKRYGTFSALGSVSLEIAQGESFGLLGPNGACNTARISILAGLVIAIAGMHSDKVDEFAVFTNFIILPLTFLSGVCYSIHSLPPFWQGLSHLNPVFDIIDGFRYRLFRHGDVSPYRSLTIVVACFIAMAWFTPWLLKTGCKLRH
jgi:ABC-type multidrug transport system permease subunit